MEGALHRTHRWDLPWKDDELFALERGVQVKVLFQDPEQGLTDSLIKFPPGYIEPRHTHDGDHSVIVVEGCMIAEGEEMHPGDYVYGAAHQAHGPFEFPEGCVVFSSMRGGTRHRYRGSPAGEM
jgi:quercetin dioxygenase-like cupin family protein